MASECDGMESVIEQRLLHYRQSLPLLCQQFYEQPGPPVCTLEFLPWSLEVEGWSGVSRGWRQEQLLLGSQAQGEEGDEGMPCLALANVTLPPAQLRASAEEGDREEGQDESLEHVVETGMGSIMFQVPDAARVQHPPGDVDRARHNPAVPNLIATKTIGKGLYLLNVRSLWAGYDGDDDEANEDEGEMGSEQVPLRTLYEPGPSVSQGTNGGEDGHGMGASRPAVDGFGLCWMSDHRLVSTLAGGKVAVLLDASTSAAPPVQLYSASSRPDGVVHDVAVAPAALCTHMFGAGTSEGDLVLWDVRVPPDALPAARIRGAHKGSCNSLSFHPHVDAPYTLASGGRDGAEGKVRLWDVRALPTVDTAASTSTGGRTAWAADMFRVHGSHHKEVIQVSWSPCVPYALASVDEDSRVFVWLMDKQREALIAPPQLRTIHEGHASPVLDLSWCLDADTPFTLASTSLGYWDGDGDQVQANVVQVWTPARALVS